MALALDPGGIIRAITAMHRQGWDVPVALMTPSDLNTEEALGELLDGATMGSGYLNPSAHPEAPGVRAWLGVVRKYSARRDITDPYCQQAYVSALLMVEALKRAGPRPTRESFLRALEGMRSFESGLRPPISFSGRQHEPVACAEYLVREEGRWRPLHPRWICVDGSDPSLPQG